MKNEFWILNLIQIFGSGFKLDPNIWIWILKKTNLLFSDKIDLDRKSNSIIWIQNGSLKIQSMTTLGEIITHKHFDVLTVTNTAYNTLANITII